MDDEMSGNEIIQFESSAIRRVWDDETKQWFFAVVDVVEVLVETERPSKYWSDLKKRVKKQSGIELSDFCGKFPMKNRKNGRTYQTDCAHVEGMFRIIQSIPSPKAEPFKLWMARVGRERIEEASDPSIALERLKREYRAIGFKEEWINKRIKAFGVSDDLLAELSERGVTTDAEQARILDTVSEGTFGITQGEHKDVKGLEAEDDLPDNMNDLELVLKMFGEASTAALAQQRDAVGFEENEDAAKVGGNLAGDSRRALEEKLGRSVVSKDNALPKSDEGDLLDGERKG